MERVIRVVEKTSSRSVGSPGSRAERGAGEREGWEEQYGKRNR